MIRRRLAPLALAGLLAMPVLAAAGPVLERIRKTGQVRVCIWPEYYGVTLRDPRSGRLTGIDVDLSAELGRDLGARIDYVDSSFTTLIDDLKGGRCDVAMFAVGVLPQRREHLRFTRAYLHSDIYAITTRGSRVVRQWADIDQPGVHVAVQAGTFMEPVMAARLRRATLVVVRPPATRERELEAGRVDVFMTDYPYSRRLLDNADWATLIEPPLPVNPIDYAYALCPGDEDWFAAMDGFVQRIHADGRLEAAARRHGLAAIVAH